MKSERKIKAVFSENFDIPDIAEYVTMPCALKLFRCPNVFFLSFPLGPSSSFCINTVCLETFILYSLY